MNRRDDILKQYIKMLIRVLEDILISKKIDVKFIAGVLDAYYRDESLKVEK